MLRKDYIFTSESVSEGHPDKVSDRISDEIVDLYLAAEPEARVAAEVLCTTNRVLIAGEVRGPSSITREMIEQKARQAIRDIGYEQEGFHWENAQIDSILHEQSTDIAIGVDSAENKDEGAGDQGIMFGYAVNEADEYMPAPISYSHKLLKALAAERHSGRMPFLEPDAKSQVTVRYKDGDPVAAEKIVLSTQHKADFKSEDLHDPIKAFIKNLLGDDLSTENTEFLINPTGNFVIGGPDGDCGLTGRKIIVDTYGGAAAHGGGAFSGKDPTKVDRSAAYVARYLAKNVVAAGLSHRCTIQISYAIGVSSPTSFYVNLHGSGVVAEDTLEKILPEMVKLTPKGIRQHLRLNRAIYARTAAYGHFGRNPNEDGGFSWEKTDLVGELKNYFNVREKVTA
ncbi:MAG: methionine adenosyltransferase [Pseudomonadota bacterium]